MVAALLTFFLLAGAANNPVPAGEEPYWKWSLSKAVKILNSSAWARQETFTAVVGGVGSGRAGEKEIYNRFYVRFLSAVPIREAYARILQIEHGYDRLQEEEKQRFNHLLEPLLGLEVDNWVVVAVSFRSNDPDQESQVRRYFQSQTAATLKDKAFLSTEQHPQVNLHAYYPPIEEGVGAKFVFPRKIGGAVLGAANQGRISFELLDIPMGRSGGGAEGGPGRGPGGGGGGGGGGGRGGGPGGGGGGSDRDAGSTILRATFALEDMVVDGKIFF